MGSRTQFEISGIPIIGAMNKKRKIGGHRKNVGPRTQFDFVMEFKFSKEIPQRIAPKNQKPSF